MSHDAPANSPTAIPPESKPLALNTARARIASAVQPIAATERVALADAGGRILAEDAVATLDVPAHANSAVDGYAVAAAACRAGDRLRLIATARAGHPFTGRIKRGECVRITTGAWLPDGADSVVMQENARVDGDRVRIDQMPSAGDNRRPAGEDAVCGQTLMCAGRYLRAVEQGVLAATGIGRPLVFRRPRVAYFSGGDELRPVGEALAPGQIYDSNRYVLAALLDELGVAGIDLGNVPDTPSAIAAAFDRAGDADAIITTGGVSVGEADHIRDTVAARGHIDFWRVAIKPGKPLVFGDIEGRPFFGLPGNPVSAAVTFMQFVRPALVQLAGGRPAEPIRVFAAVTRDIEKRPGRCEFVRVHLTTEPGGRLSATPLAHQGSGVMRSMSEANAFAVLDSESAGIKAGADVVVEPFAQPIWAL